MNPIADQCPPTTTTCPAYGLGPWNDLMTYLGHHLLIYLIIVAILAVTAWRFGRR